MIQVLDIASKTKKLGNIRVIGVLPADPEDLVKGHEESEAGGRIENIQSTSL